jgi:hypothetical protein
MFILPFFCMKKSILILVFSDLTRDARVSRQISFLQKEFELTVAALQAPPQTPYRFVKLPKPNLTLFVKSKIAFYTLTGQYKKALYLLHGSNILTEVATKPFDLIIANDIETLPFAFLNKHAKVFFDAHEYAPRQFEDRLYWRIFFKRFVVWMCKKYIHKVDGMSTVGKGLANEYLKNFGVDPLVITNAPALQQLTVKRVSGNTFKMVHHGIFNISRQPELMLDVMDLLDDRFTLDLFFVLPPSASKKTERFFKAFKERAATDKRVRVLPAIATSEIVSTLHAQYDLGLILIPPINFNYENGMPNKLFDFIQARLGLVLGPLKEMSLICTEYKLGVVSDSFTAQSVAEKLNALTINDVNQFKINADAASEILCAEKNEQLFTERVKSILSSRV